MSLEHETLTSLFTDIANSIRGKTGSSAAIKADDFPDAIDAIDVHQDVETNKTITITSSSQVINPSSGYSSMAKVTATVQSGGATPTAEYATLSSAGTSPTSVTSQYFKITPKATVGTAGWISSILDGTIQNYSVRGASTIALVGVNVTDNVTVGTESSNYYPISAKIKGNVTVGTSGWYTGSSNLAASANSQVGKIAKATFAVAGNSVGCSGGGYVPTNTTVGTVSSGSATTPATTIKKNPTLANTYTTNKGYLLSISATQNVTPTVVEGYIVSGSAGTITVQNADTPSYVAQSTWGTTSDSATYTSLAKNTKYKLSAGYYHEARYFQTQADPTLSGDAGQANVLINKTFYSNSYTKLSGTMPNNGAVSQSIGYGGSYTIPAGYHNGSGKVTNSIGAGTIDVTDLTITPNALSGSWNSSTEKYVVSQASKTADMQSVVTSAGYVSSSVGTKNKGVATVSAPSNLEIPKATFGTDGPMVGCDTAGYIPTGWVATVDIGTEGTPVATKGTASSYSLPVTPSVTNVAGYIEGGTKTGTVINVTPADLGLTLKTALSRNAGTVSLAAGSYNTSALTLTVTPENLGLTKKTALTKSGGTVSIAANSYNTSALSSTVTAGDLGLTALGATTYNPSTSDQTIAINKYTTGVQTIKGITPLTNSTYSGYLTSSTTARATTIKTFNSPTTNDIYIYPSNDIYTFWDDGYGIKINKPAVLNFPNYSSATSSGTNIARITVQGGEEVYINIPTGYNASTKHYTIEGAYPMIGSFMISDWQGYYSGEGYEMYPFVVGQTYWMDVINSGITFFGEYIEKDSGLIMIYGGPYSGMQLLDENDDEVYSSDLITAGVYHFDYYK